MRKLVRILLALGTLGLVVALGFGWWLKRQIDSGLVEREASRLLAGAAGIQAKFGSIRFGTPGTLRIEVLDVKGPRGQDELTFRFDLLELDYSVADLFLRLKVKIHGIRLLRPRIRAVVTRMPQLPRAPEGAKKPALDLAFLERELVARLTIEDGELSVENRLEARPLTLTVKALNLDVQFPKRGSPIRIDLKLAPMGGLITAAGQYTVATRSGSATVNINLPDLSFLGPQVEARKLGLKIERLGVALSGEVSREGDKLDYALSGRVDPLRVELAAPVKLVAGGTVALSVKPHEVALSELKLEAEGVAPLSLSARLSGFANPMELVDPEKRALALVVADLKLAGLSVASVLPLVPPDRIPAALNLEPAGTLDVSAHVTGRLGNPHVTAAVKLSGVKGSLSRPPISGPFAIAGVELTVDDRAITVGRLALSALGLELAATAVVRDWRTAPALELAVQKLDVDIARTLAHVKGLPVLVAKLAPEGALHLGLSLAASLGPELAREGLAWPRDATLLVGRLKAEVERLRATPPDALKPAVEALVKRFGVRAAVDLALVGGRARVEQAPGGVVEADLAAHADPAGVEIERLVAGLPGLKAGLRAKLTDPLGARHLAAQLKVPVQATPSTSGPFAAPAWAQLAHLASLAPQRVTTGAPVKPPLLFDGRVRVEAAAVGPLSGGRLPEVGARVELQAVKALVRTDVMDLAVEVPQASFELLHRSLSVPEFRVLLPCVGFSVAAQAGPLVDPAAPLTLAGIKELVSLEAIPFSVKLATLADRPLDLARVAAALPLPRHPRLSRFKPQGQLTLAVEAGGTAAKAAARADLKLGIVGLALEAHGRSDDLRSKHIESSLELTAGKLSETIQALAPGTPVAPLDRLPPTTEARVTASLSGRPGNFKMSAQVQALDFAAELAGTLDQLPRPQETQLSGKWTLDSVDKLKPLFPEKVRAKYDEIKPRFRLSGPLKLTGRGPRNEVEVGVEVTDVHAAWEGFTGPVKLDLDRLSLIARTSVVQGAPAPWSGIADLEGKGGRVQIKGKTIPVQIPLSRVAFAPDRVSTEKLHLKVLDQDILLSLELSRDLAREKRIDVDLNIPGLDPGHLIRALGVPETQATGRISLRVTARGPLDHPELVEPAVDLTIPHLDVKHPALKGLPLVITNGRVQVTRDDIVIPAAGAWQIKFGANQFAFPISGSIKEIARVPNLFRADPRTIAPRILERIGGEKKISALLGEEQMLRLIGDKLYKVLISIKIADRTDAWVFKGALAPDDTRLFKEKTHEIVEKYTLIAKQKLAESMGFKKAVHGEENYKLLRIERVVVTILDQGFNMVYPREIPFWRLTVTPAEW